MSLPIVEELTAPPEPHDALRAFAEVPGVLLLDSARRHKQLGRYSFLTADPYRFCQLDSPQFGADPFAEIRRQLDAESADTRPDLPPFQGGAAGLLSYELGGCFERLPRAAADEFQLPALATGFYDWALAWDHDERRAWIISHGFPETTQAKRRDRAAARLRWAVAQLNRSETSTAALPSGKRLDASKLARRCPVPGRGEWLSNFSADDYLRAVERAIEYIYAGDIFQVNLSQRLLHPQHTSPVGLYCDLRERNPAPFAGYFAHDDWTVVSASPERFVKVANRVVSSRPIKGTRQRQTHPEADLFTRDELRESEKDQAENVMIVDLLRNDLSRVCTPGTIRVPELCRVETYETVQHLVSEIQGTLADRRDCWDLLSAVFPGGSITGAPKVRAMEIIAELEPTVRGPYCGSLFYVGYDGTMDSSILIRTFTVRRGWIQCPVGGGIVAQSSPQAEYQETWHKAAGMLAAIDRGGMP